LKQQSIGKDMAETATITWIKTKFPLWTDFCDADEAVLSSEIDMALLEMNDFVTIPEVDFDFTAVNPLNIHFLNIVRKRCFDIKQSETDFHSKPTIVKDYERTLDALKEYQAGVTRPNPVHDSDNENLIDIDAKTRVFGSWFVGLRGSDLTDINPNN